MPRAVLLIEIEPDADLVGAARSVGVVCTWPDALKHDLALLV
jgi:hypothetical protein